MREDEYSIGLSRQRVQHVQRHWGVEELMGGGGQQELSLRDNQRQIRQMGEY